MQHDVIVPCMMKRFWVLAHVYGREASLVPRLFGAAPKEPGYEGTVKHVDCVVYFVFVASLHPRVRVRAILGTL